MENGSLITLSPMDGDRIDYGSYTASLIKEAVRVGLLDEMASVRIRGGLLALLRVQLDKSTHGESTSVTTEAADALIDGIGYCVDLALQSAPSIEQSVTLLQTRTIEELYQSGAALLNADARACSALLSRVRATRTKTVNAGYQITLDDSLPNFLREWHGNPFPHDFAVIIEYPLAIEVTQSGIAGVHACLAALALENRFCAHFAAGLTPLLSDYARQNRTTPVDAYVNLFTITLRNLLLCRLLGLNGTALSEADADILQAKLAAQSAASREQCVLHAAELLLADCAFENERLENYVRRASRQFAASITDSNLSALAVISRGETPMTLLTDGERLDDDTFLDVTNEILLCEGVSGKIHILRDEVHNLDDLCDLLEADCIFEDEFYDIFASLEDSVCALLLTRLPVEMEDGNLSLQSETEWQLRFLRYANGKDKSELRNLYRLLTGV